MSLPQHHQCSQEHPNWVWVCRLANRVHVCNEDLQGSHHRCHCSKPCSVMETGELTTLAWVCATWMSCCRTLGEEMADHLVGAHAVDLYLEPVHDLLKALNQFRQSGRDGHHHPFPPAPPLILSDGIGLAPHRGDWGPSRPCDAIVQRARCAVRRRGRRKRGEALMSHGF